ncbi:T9SS type A sorting domain-containing protein [Chitinophaga rhizophila]|uniref:T9SS type A sorting domain-containing protein n=1 Tax=Chitinophaga rhizophila TaxID=2866212 RepID=A0ABS7GJN3_9BACT|nr:T9SS type A sorting domain-containing protein [Chitinophaga rhizophila]MBW8687924.1 T9SS type A sorting domain-containing protein [Chitinophaga rhizophila]
MRKTLLALLCLLTGNLYAQNCPQRTVTTQWNVAGTSNTWNWSTPFYDDAYIKNRSSTIIPSPFYSPTSSIHNPGLIFLMDPAVKDLLPGEGWELLVKDFGNNGNLPATAVTNPFFALYNRYTATIRVFFLVVDPLSGTNNGATISLSFESGDNGNESAMLAFASPITTAIDRFEKRQTMRMPNRYANEFDYWLFADFPMAYDPCTCLYNSKITFNVQLIQNTQAKLDLKIKGSSSGSIKQVIQASPGGVQASGGSNSILSMDGGIIKAGQEGYKNWQAFANVTNNVAAGITTLAGMDDKAKLASQVSQLASFTKAIPYVGAVMGVLDFFIGGGKSAARSAPMAFNSNMSHELTGTATGELELSTTRGYRTINTPGTNISGSSTAIPTYDNILGVFNLVETPMVEYLEYKRAANNGIGFEQYNPDYNPNCQPTPDDPYACEGNDPVRASVIAQHETTLLQYRVVSPIKYALNPAAKLDVVDIKAAIVVSDTVRLGAYGFNHPAYFGNLPAYSSTAPNVKLNMMGYEYENDTRYRTAFVPLGCLSNTSIGVTVSRTLVIPEVRPADIYVKIMATFRRKDAGPDTQDILFVGTYRTQQRRSDADPRNLTFRCITTNRKDAGLVDVPPYEFPNTYYYQPSAIIFPQPVPGIAGVADPVFPAGCPTGVVPAQTEQQLIAFCNDATKYKPRVTGARNYVDAYRPKESVPETPKEMLISLSNAPNPMRDETKINFSLPSPSEVRIFVSDITGNTVDVILNKTMPEGQHNIIYRSNKLQSGTYFYTLMAGSQKVTNKLVVVK